MIMARVIKSPQTDCADSPPVVVGISEISFCAWIAQAEAGEPLIYHHGFLVVDTDPEPSRVLAIRSCSEEQSL